LSGKKCEVKVVAPLPWSPPFKIKDEWYKFSKVPEQEIISGIDVFHPRYFMIPKIGRFLYPFYFFLSLYRKVKKIHEIFPYDVIYAPWIYPDGVGSFMLAKALNKPVVLGALGTDINEYTKYFIRRKLIAYALKNSDGVIAVSRALKARMAEIGAPADAITVVPNGVDTGLFKPLDQPKARDLLNIPHDNKVILFVGRFVPVKGLDGLIEAFAILCKTMKSLTLVLVGNGECEAGLKEKALNLGVSGNVMFIGNQPYEKINQWMNACDVFCLPSINEGSPNVLLEALSCGKPVVASRVGGIPDIITSEEYGLLVPVKDTDSLAKALAKALTEKKWSKEVIRKNNNLISWENNANMIYNKLETAILDFKRKNK
jgi:glycosyltransferase involved in cell wall biosynthesis